MRIVVWNCCQAFSRKADHLASLRPDIAIVPECSHRDAERHETVAFSPRSRAWIGANRAKGLAVFSFGGYSLRIEETYDPRLQWVLPLHVEGQVSFRLLAVWAMNHRASMFHPQAPTRRQIQQSLFVYERFLHKGPSVITGDFNDAPIWDRKRPHPENFKTSIGALEGFGLKSAYHIARGVEFGQEPEPTIYWRNRTLDGPRYHIDYCFVPGAWTPGLTVDVGSHADWVATGRSDHVPLIVEIAPELLARCTSPFKWEKQNDNGR